MILKNSHIRSMIFGSLSMSSVTVIRMLAQIMVVPVLARLLSPTEYGLVGIAMPFILFVMVFSDVGMANSLVRGKDAQRNESEWSSSFWLITGLGVSIAGLISIIAPFMAYFLNEPRLTNIIMSLSLVILLQSIATVPGAVLVHEKKFGTIAWIEIFSIIVSIALTFYSAKSGAGVWALVIQQISHFSCRGILTFFYSKFKPRFLFTYSQIASHLEFGKNLLGSNIIGNIIPMLTNFILGHQLGMATVGVVGMAQLFSQLPARIVSGPLQYVLYPYIAHAREHISDIRLMFMFITRLLALLVIPILGMMAVAHEPIFNILLSEKWWESGLVFMLLAPAAALQTVTALRFTVMMGLGRTDLMLRQAVESSILFFIVLAITINFGLEAVAIGMCLTSFIYFPRSVNQVLPLVNLGMIEYLKTMLIPTIITILTIFIYLSISISFPTISDWHLFGEAFILGLFAFIASCLFQAKTLSKEFSALSEVWSSIKK